jgi:alpha-1,6-mannosyltransferase
MESPTPDSNQQLSSAVIHSLIKGAIVGLSFPIALYLTIEITRLGVDKFHYILAGGKRFATFPNQESYLSISLSYLMLVILHLIWVLGSDIRPTFPTFLNLLKRASIFLLFAFIAYPLGNDVYLYLHVGLMNLAKVDPFLTQAGAFVSELTPFVDWKQTSTYGPVSQLLFAISAATLRLHPILAVYVFKIFCLAAHVLNSYLVWKIAPHDWREKGAIAYLLCPVLLMEQVASAHVDVFVSTSALVLAGCLFKERYGTAFLAIWGGFLTKTVPIIWLPLLGLFLLRKWRWKQLLVGGLVSGSLIAVLSLTVLRSTAAWRSLLNPGVVGQYQSSIPALIRAGLETIPFFIPEALPASDYRYPLLYFSQYLLVAYAAFYGWKMVQILYKRHYTAANLLADMGWVTLALMLYATSWLMPWYVSIVYAIAVVLPKTKVLGITVLMFGLSSAAMYALQGDAGLRALVAIGLPTLAILVSPPLFRKDRYSSVNA